MTTPSEPPRSFNPRQYGQMPPGEPGPPQRPPYRPGPQQQVPPQQQMPPQQEQTGPPPVRRKGVVAALFDTRFDAMVTPMLIRWFYLLALLVISLQCTFFLITGLVIVDKELGWFWGVCMIGASPLVWIVEALGVRMALEFVINQFKITEELQKIRRNTGPSM